VSLLASSLLVLCTASVVAAALGCLYHLGLMAVALVCRRQDRPCSGPPTHSFAIVIPAHDEEITIKCALDSCATFDYPKEKYTVYVIADNCSDRTAEVAREDGAVCLVRQDAEKLGKGFALEWALPKVLAAGHDAILILDADCQIDSHALLVFDEQLSHGARGLQASDVVGNSDESPTSYVLALANALENQCFYAPKSMLGLAVLLRGTGMVFHREVLHRFPWHAQSIAEDSEYSFELLKQGIGIRFVPEVRVASDFPVGHEQLTVQRARWIGGGMRVVATWGPRLAWEGLASGRVVLLDAVLTMLVASRPFVITQLLLTLLLCFINWSILPTPWAVFLLICCAAIVAGYTVYVGVGFALLGVRAKQLKLVLQAPFAVAAYLFIAIKSLFGANVGNWNRTPRIESHDQGRKVSAHSQS